LLRPGIPALPLLKTVEIRVSQRGWSWFLVGKIQKI
jgi:hypothetical protein